MTDPTAIPPDPVPPAGFPAADLLSDSWQFDTTVWHEAPAFTPDDIADTELVARRNANHAAYQQIGTPTTWLRYLTLGYYAFDDASLFDIEWNNGYMDPANIHRIISYNYLYHVDRDIQLPDKLELWTTKISHPHLWQQDDVESTSVNTFNFTWPAWKKWKSSRGAEPMEVDNPSDWSLVKPRGRSRNNSPRPTPDITPANIAVTEATSTASTSETTTYGAIISPDTINNNPQPTSTTNAAWNLNLSEQNSGSFANDDETRPDAIIHLPTNDGTHRVIIKWKVDQSDDDDDMLTTLENNKLRMDQALLKILKHIFDERDGQFYRWESEDLVQAKNISDMTVGIVRDFVTPAITCIHSRQLLIFGARFCFNTNPVKWKNAMKQEALKSANLQVQVSNSRCTSGKLVIAGYILLKAPNATHRHRYVQHLIRQLPANTPFFDIVRLVRTPQDQVMPHLAVQCGEKHVAPLCQALLNYLTGETKAIFLPRYALSTMTDTKIAHDFDIHTTWVRSLCPLPLAPMVSHIDQPRREYNSDGTITIRSAREWVETLTLSDNITPAQCDIVNGTADRKTSLLVPRHYLAEAKEQLRQYKQRLSPPTHRAARYRDSLPGLPNEIQITSLCNSNLSFMDKMSAAAHWSNAPSSVRGRATLKGTNSNPSTRHGKNSSSSRFNFGAADSGGSNTSHQRSMSVVTDTTYGKQSQTDHGLDRVQPPAGTLAAGNDEGESNASTPLTRGSSLTTAQAKFRELDDLIKRQQSTIDAHAKQSTERMSKIEQHFQRFDELNQRIDKVSSQVIQSTASNQEMILSLRSDIEAHNKTQHSRNIAFQSHCDTQTSQLGNTVLRAMEEIALMRSDISKLTNFMMKDITTRASPSAEPKRRKQRIKQNIFDDLMPGVQLQDTTIPEDIEMTPQEYEDDDFSDHSPQNLAMQLETAFHAQEDNEAKLAAESPLPPSPTQPPFTAGSLAQPFQEDTQQTEDNRNFSPPVPSTTPDVTTQMTTPSNLTQLPNLRSSQTNIQRFFSSAPLNSRNNKTTDSAGANTK